MVSTSVRCLLSTSTSDDDKDGPSHHNGWSKSDSRDRPSPPQYTFRMNVESMQELRRQVSVSRKHGLDHDFFQRRLDNAMKHSLKSPSTTTIIHPHPHMLARRAVLAGLISTSVGVSLIPNAAQAATPFWKQPSSLYVVSPRLRNTTNTATAASAAAGGADLSYLRTELCILKLLPVRSDRKVVFKAIQGRLEGLALPLTASSSGDGVVSSTGWTRIQASMQEAIELLDRRRDQLAPVFNPEDSTLLAIDKGEQGELRIETLRALLVDIRATAAKAGNATLSTETGTTAAGAKVTPLSSYYASTVKAQKQALLSLAEVGELLVSTFPYDVPSEGRWSYLPRLTGRARVTFTFKREGELLGNITILADGYTAPITAGNFVDLCVRNFYTGLAIKNQKKRLQEGPDFDVANVPILGSYQEGFYDPLTAKLRRVPLEIIRVEKSNGVPSLSYSQGLSSLTTSTALSNKISSLNFSSIPILSSSTQELAELAAAEANTVSRIAELAAAEANSVSNFFGSRNSSVMNGTTERTTRSTSKSTKSIISPPSKSTTIPNSDVNSTATSSETNAPSKSTVAVEPESFSKPLLSFNIPGLVAMNHPDKNLNGASSEFFCLQSESLVDEKRKWLDGEYAPFGYIISGYESVYEKLRPGDVIDSTTVDDWGLLNLVKLRRASFSEVQQRSASEEIEGAGSGGDRK